MISAKAKGKQRAVQDGDEEDGVYAGGKSNGHHAGGGAQPVTASNYMTMDLDTEDEDSSNDGSVAAFEARRAASPRRSNGVYPSAKKRRRLDKSISQNDPSATNGHGEHSSPSSSTQSVTADLDNIGSSISRSARMNAAAQSQSGDATSGDGSSSSSDDDDDDPEDVAAIAAALTRFDASTSNNHASHNSRNGASRGFVTASRGEAYLHAMARPAKTSNKKLSEANKLRKPFTQRQYLDALAEAQRSPHAVKLESDICAIEQAYHKLFSQWAFEATEGMSVFLYGFGSKIRVLEDFGRYVHRALRRQHRRISKRGRVIEIRGYMASLAPDELLTALERVILTEEMCDEPLRQGKSAAKLDERLTSLLDYLDSADSPWSERKPIWLLVPSIDGVALRSFRSQAILSSLAGKTAVRVVATFDHVKAPLLWPTHIARPSVHRLAPTAVDAGQGAHDEMIQTSAHVRGYNMIYHHVPTWRPYTVECVLSGTTASIFSPSIYVSDAQLAASGMNGFALQSSEMRAKSAYYVLASATEKCRAIFVLLAEKQMAMMTGKEGANSSVDADVTPGYAIRYAALFSLARDRFLANNVAQMESQLLELRDHHIMLANKAPPADEGLASAAADTENDADVGNKASEWVWICIDKVDLSNLLERLQ